MATKRAQKTEASAPPAIDVKTALKPRLMAVEEMRPHPENPRTHPEAQVEGLGGAYQEFGVLQLPVVDEDGMILAGEGRWLAAQKKGVPKLPVIQVTGWSADKKRAFMVADNRWAQIAGFDEAKLREVMAQLREVDYDLAPIGYDLKEVEAMLAGAQAPTEFQAYSENLATEHQCPKCGYVWSGSSAPKAKKPPAAKQKTNGSRR